MCGFLFTSIRDTNRILKECSHKLSSRGPDFTNIISINSRTILHDLLSLNGHFEIQPVFIDSINAYLWFNGEIYNSEVSINFKGNDTQYLKSLLSEYLIEDVISQIDGEYLICLYYASSDQIVICSDLFGTKPAWFGYDVINKGWGLSSYKSVLYDLNIRKSIQIPPNTILKINLEQEKIIYKSKIIEFSFNSGNINFSDWCMRFDQSLLKRIPKVGNLLIPVSSGMDSGLIAYRIKSLGINACFVSLPACEDKDVMFQRQEQLGIEFISINKLKYMQTSKIIKTKVEDFNYRKSQPLLDINYLSDDPGAIGLYSVLQHGKNKGCLVSFSGQGADEIYSDYGYKGKPLANVSSLFGEFPNQLNTIFPWKNLFSGTQRAYLMKDEHISGSLGMESRYPFLDKSLFEAFIELPSQLKNNYYKGPIGKWTSELNIPCSNRKLGFSANRGLQD